MFVVFCVVIRFSIYAVVQSAGLSELGFDRLNFRSGVIEKNTTSAIIASCDRHKRPGCERLCAMTRGCKSFFYNHHSAVCQLHDAILDCSTPVKFEKYSQYFYKDEATVYQGVSGRLLLTRRYPADLIQYHLENRSVQAYAVPFTTNTLYAMTYSPELRSILFSVDYSLIICKLDESECRSKNFSLKYEHDSMTVDEQLLFLKCGIQRSILRVDLKTMKFAYIVQHEWHIADITLDTSYKWILVAFRSGALGAFSYDGTCDRMMKPNGQLEKVYFDNEHRKLYYANGKRLMSSSLYVHAGYGGFSLYSTKTLITLTFTPLSLLYHESRVYVSGFNGRDVFVGFVQESYYELLCKKWTSITYIVI